jgi:hypothetical protein
VKIQLAAQRYEVHLPVAVWAANQNHADGVTESMSSHDIRFSVDDSVRLQHGSPIMLFVSLPSELTSGKPVQLRASGQIVEIESRPVSDDGRTTLVAAMDWYDFIRSSDPQGQAEAAVS